jgi:hypothetical protein
VRGHLFEYELVDVGREGATMRYTERVMKPNGQEFELFKERADAELMVYPVADIDDSHELWQKALARSNAHIHENNERMRRAAQPSNAMDECGSFDLSDIDTLFKEKGKGPHMYEIEFIAAETGPIEYPNKHGEPAKYWVHTHRLTGYSLRRYLNAGGKTYESGRLSKCLLNIKQQQHPLAFARAQHICTLNDSKPQSSDGTSVALVMDRRELLGQQVRLKNGMIYLVRPPSSANIPSLSFFRSSVSFLQSRQTLLRLHSKGRWPNYSFETYTPFILLRIT